MFLTNRDGGIKVDVIAEVRMKDAQGKSIRKRVCYQIVYRIFILLHPIHLSMLNQWKVKHILNEAEYQPHDKASSSIGRPEAQTEIISCHECLHAGNEEACA